MDKSKTEKALVKACLRGDLASQKRLYSLFAYKMLGVCRRFSKSKEEAEDILQDGFLKVFHDLPQYKAKGSLEGWIRQVIVNIALQHVRRRKLLFAPILEVEKMLVPDQSYDQIFLRFEVNELLSLLNTLPSGARYIFNLYVLEGFTHKEIAEKLGVSIGTSKSQLSKARSILKSKFVIQNKSKVNGR